MGDSQISSIWTRSELGLHINILELKAVMLALRHWVSVLQGHQVIFPTDNTTVVAYIIKQGGTLLRLVWDVFLWLQIQDIAIQARHIAGCLNVIADQLSRLNQPITTELRLHPEIVNLIFGTGETQQWPCLAKSTTCIFPSLCPISGASSTGNGCSVTRLAGTIDVHISTVSPAQQSHSEAQDHPGGQSDTNSPLVAISTVVSTPTTSVRGLPSILSVMPRPTVTRGICLERQVIPSACMEALLHHYQAAGFSKEVSRLTAAPRRPSTNKMYDDRWLHFAYWGTGQGIDLLGATFFMTCLILMACHPRLSRDTGLA